MAETNGVVMRTKIVPAMNLGTQVNSFISRESSSAVITVTVKGVCLLRKISPYNISLRHTPAEHNSR